MVKKKIIALIVIFTIIMSTILPAGNVLAATAPTFTINGAEVERGTDTVTVKLNLSDNTSGLRILAGNIEFDQEKLEYVSAEINGLANANAYRSVAYSENLKVIRFNASCSGLQTAAMDDNGDIITITFKIKDGASGDANITIAMDDVVDNDGNRIEDYKTVDGKVTIKVPTSGIKLDMTTLELNAGDTKKLNATVEPADATNQNIKWSSDDEKVATVAEDGTVTAVGIGNATITAKTEDGNYTASCTITVTCPHTKTTVHPAIASTCQVQGNMEYVTCDTCGKVVSGSDEKLPLAEHEYGTLIEKVEPIHTAEELKDGKEAYYQCSVCGKLFNEEKQEVTEEDLIIKAPSHTYGEWEADAENHWKSCGCGNIIDLESHTGGKATCTEQATCEVCGAKYGELDLSNHGDTEIRDSVEATCTEEGYTGDTYCKDCGTLIKQGETIQATGHTGGVATCTKKAICEVCGEEYGEVDSSNHGNTEIRDSVEATCTEEGYTGDTYCKDCDTLIKQGETISAAGHKGGIATCIEKAVCEVCGEEYGEINPSNHINTEIRNAIDATNETEGYTGDTYCKDCGTLIKQGEVIPVIEEPQEEPVEEPQEEENQTEEGKDKQESNVQEDSTKPKTDDNSNMMLWISLLVISGICFVVIAKCKTKEKRIGRHTK